MFSKPAVKAVGIAAVFLLLVVAFYYWFTGRNIQNEINTSETSGVEVMEENPGNPQDDQDIIDTQPQDRNYVNPGEPQAGQSDTGAFEPETQGQDPADGNSVPGLMGM